MNPKTDVVIAALMAITVATGCASSQKTTADWDSSVDLASFAGFPPPARPEG